MGITMKITNITTYILRAPLGKDRFFSSQCAFPERNSLLVSQFVKQPIHALLGGAFRDSITAYATG